MKRFLLAVLMGLVCVGIAEAVPSFTPVLDGVKDAGWGSTPDEATTTLMEPVAFNLNSGLYVTDDGTYLYFGFEASPDQWTDGASVHAHIELDVGGTAGGGYFDQWGSSVHYGMPFLPEYDIITQWNTDNQLLGWTGLEEWMGSSWSQTQVPASQIAGGNGWAEIALRKTSIGNPAEGTVLHLSMWQRPAWNKPNANACVPADATFPSNYGDGAGGTFTTQFAYTLQAAGVDTTHPHLLSVHQIDRRSVEMVFNEPMDIATLNTIGNYTPVGWISSGIRYATAINSALYTPMDFTPGSPYGVSLGAGIHDISGNSIDPAFDSLGWTGVGYADVTFTVIDLPAVQDTLLIKGSFNFYHEYDAAWTGGNVLMYDDGTHGDPVAHDHQFTVILPLVPSASTFEWGFVDEQGNWLPTANQTFSLPDLNPIAVSYTIPNPTTQDVTVTFACDMQFINAQIMTVRLAGSMNGWIGADMADPEADKLWTLSILFPAGSARHQEFKFQRIDSSNAEDWEADGNRMFEIDDTAPTQVLPNIYFNNWLPSPTVTAYANATGGVDLRWDNWPRVHFQILDGDDPANIGNIVATVSGNLYAVPAPLDVRKFYFVKTTE